MCEPWGHKKSDRVFLEQMRRAGTNIGFMDKAAALQGPVRMDVNRGIKRALDPNGVIAPGKSGITI
jgi:FAD/FMN-containing dehydrogenase